MTSKPLLAFAALILLAGCSNAKKELGLEKTPPDEFAITKRAPLAMPPDFTLRPPQPGAPRPQEQATAEQARTAVLGERGANGAGKGEAALLQEAGAAYDPDIRGKVDYEATKTERKKQPVVKKLLNIGKDQPPAAKIVDPAAETQRLQKNAAEGKPVTAGETPAIEN